MTKILAAAERARAAREPLRVVDDEWGNPTWTPWLANAIEALTFHPRGMDSSVWHLAGEPPTSRRGWAVHVLRDVDVQILPIALAEYPRASQPPRRAILDTGQARAIGLNLEWTSYDTRGMPIAPHSEGR